MFDYVNFMFRIAAFTYKNTFTSTGYDTKQAEAVASVMLKLWGMQSTPSLPSLLGPLWPGVVAPERVLFKGDLELIDI